MSVEDIQNRRWTEAERQVVQRVAKRQAVGDDSHIDFTDIPRLTKTQLANMVSLQESKRKVAVSVRLDSDVLVWLKSKGDGHLTRINDILHNLMEAEKSAK